MNKIEALEILGFEEDSEPTEEEIKKAFKKKAVKLHPDVNKSETAEDDFKKINAAQDCLLNPKPYNQYQDDDMFQTEVERSHFKDILRNFGFTSRVNISNSGNENIKLPEIIVPIKLTFEESVLSCNKDISFERFVFCRICNGFGKKTTNKKCATCNGVGMFTQRKGNFMVSTTCPQCGGSKYELENCQDCNKGFTKQSADMNVKLPGGLLDGQIIRLAGAGHIRYTHFGNSANHAFLNISVEKNPNMIVIGQDIISALDISLLDAIKGQTKEVDTILGKTNIRIVPLSRNKDKITLDGYGVEKRGKHIFELNVLYPDNINDLVQMLEIKNKRKIA
jgi:molecular chaperone DnaJ